MSRRKYLTVVVQNNETLQWEVMVEDIRLQLTREQDILDRMGIWTAKREAVYPKEHWRAWTQLTDIPGQWRTAFAAQNGVEPPPSTVRPRHQLR